MSSTTWMPCIINAQALPDALRLSGKKHTVEDKIARDSRFALRILAGISRRLHGLVNDVEVYSLHIGIPRVIGHLLRDTVDIDGDLPITDCESLESRLSVVSTYRLLRL